MKEGFFKRPHQEFDLILAVDKVKPFHEANLRQNKNHYTLFSQVTKGKVVTFF